MKRKIFQVVLGLFIMMGAFTLFAPQAEAITINIQNPYQQKMSVAIVYFEDSTNKWVVRGWYSVEPRQTRALNFSGSTKRDSVWIHANTSEATFGGSGIDPKRYTVTREAFKYFAGEPAPNGTNRRQVGFDRWYAQNGAVYWKP
jgi:uncharacterized membrane protein